MERPVRRMVYMKLHVTLNEADGLCARNPKLFAAIAAQSDTTPHPSTYGHASDMY